MTGWNGAGGTDVMTERDGGAKSIQGGWAWCLKYGSRHPLQAGMAGWAGWVRDENEPV